MKKKKILLIDDDLKNSIFLKHFIEEESYEVNHAINGKTGWELYLSFQPDLILLDINMPEMDGFELAMKIRKQDKKVIIFFLTDRIEINDRLKGFSLKGNDYIPKPFYPEELIAKINERFNSSYNTEKEIFEIGHTIFNYSLCNIEFNNITKNLSLRQADILRVLIENVNTVVQREYLLDKIWGHINYSNSLSLNVQITYLRRLLEQDNSISIISLRNKGYVLKNSSG